MSFEELSGVSEPPDDHPDLRQNTIGSPIGLNPSLDPRQDRAC
jgi:hypothetical protein